MHVPVKPEPCRTDGPPLAPTLHAEACGNKVCLTPDDAVAIWEYVRENERRWERAQVCLDTQSAHYSNPDPLGTAPIIGAYRRTFPELDFTIHYRLCGEENAYYTPSTHEVVICSEYLERAPGVVRFALAHELAHAAITQYNIAYTGLHETAADELATLMLFTVDHLPDAAAMAQVLLSDKTDLPPSAPYAENDARAHQLLRLIMNLTMENGEGRRVVLTWIRLITEAQ